METRNLNKHFEELAELVIEQKKELEAIRKSKVKIVYLQSDKNKKDGRSNVIFGECEKIPDKYKWKINADFSIVLFTPNTDGLNDEQLKILLFHELLHVGIEKAGTEKENYYIVPHDFEDFKAVVEQYGADWVKNPNILF